MADAPVNLWTEVAHVLAYLGIADSIPHRTEGEAELLASLPQEVGRVLDLGCGDGRLLALVRTLHPGCEGVAVDFSDEMVRRARDRFGDDPRVTVIQHDLEVPLASLGAAELASPFDAVVSSFAIHHLVDAGKRARYAEAYALLRPGGTFLNLEHVASATPALHLEFLGRLGVGPDKDDPSNKLVLVEEQLAWLRAIGFADVDCLWRWRELALLAGVKPVP